MLYPEPRFKIGDIVKVKSETDPDMLAVVNGLKLGYFDQTRQHVWYVNITDRQSEYRDLFDEDDLEPAEAKTEDQKWRTTGGNVPIRPMTNCWQCEFVRIDDGFDCPYCSADRESDNGMDTAAQAIEMAQSLDLDTAVRTVARSGRKSGPNYYAVWEDMNITATFGAGTNRASVDAVVPKATIYRALEYGRHIEVFRNGPWVQRLIGFAQFIGKANKIKEQEAAHISDNFKKVDF